MTLIVHRDERCVVVDKPSGLSTHRGWDDTDDALLQRVRDEVNAYVYPVNRLDRGASGLVLFALDKEAAAAFASAWPTADKRYLAITRGHPPEHLVIDHAIPKAPGADRVPAVTEIWRREVFGRYALVEARPQTGRLHQIRRHLKHIACPLIGDVRYGKGEHNRIWRERFALHRLALHCTSLTVAHPSGTTVVASAALPADMAAALDAARTSFS
ncbi:MAG TPA: pseudouridine synthase [Kofleriaceae bacterium]|nr:pseudouridine synthase [Kofleriaceae bacterium]